MAIKQMELDSFQDLDISFTGLVVYKLGQHLVDRRVTQRRALCLCHSF